MTSSKTGRIYILRNPYLKDAVIKIGRTSRITENRAKEISSSTGVPFEYEVLYDEDVLDSHLAEKLIHQKLNKSRINTKREFFQIPLKVAVKTVFETCLEVNSNKANEASSRLLIEVNSNWNKNTIKKLTELLAKHKGDELDIYIFFDSGEDQSLLRLSEESNVKLSPSLINEIKNLKGVSDVLWTKSEKHPMENGF